MQGRWGVFHKEDTSTGPLRVKDPQDLAHASGSLLWPHTRKLWKNTHACVSPPEIFIYLAWVGPPCISIFKFLESISGDSDEQLWLRATVLCSSLKNDFSLKIHSNRNSLFLFWLLKLWLHGWFFLLLCVYLRLLVKLPVPRPLESKLPT